MHYFNFDSSVQCPPSAVPGSEVNFVITLPPVECPPNLKLALLQVCRKVNHQFDGWVGGYAVVFVPVSCFFAALSVIYHPSKYVSDERTCVLL